MKHESRPVALAVTVFVTVAAILLFYDSLFGQRVVVNIGRQLLQAVQPILYGAFIAYLLSPMVDFFEGHLFASAVAKARSAGRISRGARAVSLILTWLVIYVLFHLLASILLPELYRSVLQLFGSAESYYNTISGWIQHLLESNPDVEHWVTQQMNTYYEDIQTWLTKEALPQATTLMTAVSGGVMTVLVFFKDLLVGIIASVYLLATKEHCAAYARKMTYALVPTRYVDWVLRGARKTDEIFAGFVRGKLLDSLIIGIICFVGCSILKFPYTPLVSVIVGVTNVIPFFGPFLGAIPSIFLILLVNPLQAVYFMLFVLALQQLDGNVIGPKILGDKTGLSSLWVIIAILVGGSFFGVPGMFFGVPVCACLYNAVDFFLRARLRRKDLPTDDVSYDRPGAVVSAQEEEKSPDTPQKPL
jgi:predicted PurR-regulated permease PerM|nr:AI-2E family transporter [uncultured Oscillibacter sp.]